jgi:opacity protein-like surface antigen
MLKRLMCTLATAALCGTMASSASSGPLQNYWNSNDGDTGGYLEVAYTKNSISDIDDKYGPVDQDTGTSSAWAIDKAQGGKLQVGNDWGKIRFDFKLAAGHAGVESINSVAADGDDAAFASLSLNLYWDIYRLGLTDDKGIFAPAVTPYIGVGGGGGVVAMKAGQTGNTRDQALSGGPMWHWTAGLLFDVTESIGVSIAYDYSKISGVGRRNVTGTDDHTNKSVEVGLRITF